MKCLQETGPDFVIRNMEDYLTGSKFCDLAFICDDNLREYFGIECKDRELLEKIGDWPVYLLISLLLEQALSNTKHTSVVHI